MPSAEDWGKRLQDDSEGAAKSIVWKVILFIVLLAVVLSVAGWVLGWFSKAGQVAQQQFGPDAMLKKYEWFKEQSAAIKKMEADIDMFKQREQKVKEQYAGYGDDMTKWPPDVRVQYNHAAEQSRDDRLAVTSQRNNLVRDYNAASSKFNWEPFLKNADRPDQSYKELE